MDDLMHVTGYRLYASDIARIYIILELVRVGYRSVKQGQFGRLRD